MGQVYRLNFPNGKSYIGITAKTAVKRFSGHLAQTAHGRSLPLNNAIRLHGESAISLDVLAEESDWDLLCLLEMTFIDEFKTIHPHGYNLTVGGDGFVGFKRSPENIEKVRQSKIGKKTSDETKEKMRQAMIGRKMSPEWIAKMSAARFAWWERKRNQL